MAPQGPESPSYPLYSTTFIIYRLSPLYHGDTVLNNYNLRQYASRFRDVLAGDVLRGVRVGLVENEEGLARAGTLQSVHWRLLVKEEEWHTERDIDGDTMNFDHNMEDIHVEVKYEKATYTAIILHKSKGGEIAEVQDGFSHYPLLLTRMPGALRGAFLHFLATNFDSRASVLKLPSQFLSASLEKYIENIVTVDNEPMQANQASKALQIIIRDLLVTVMFDLPSGNPTLKTMDITIVKEDLWRMLTRGRNLQQARNMQLPFTEALYHYIESHLAIDMRHPYVSISKIACGAFVLGAEGRVKLFAPNINAPNEEARKMATKALVTSMMELAKTGKMIAGVQPPP